MGESMDMRQVNFEKIKDERRNDDKRAAVQDGIERHLASFAVLGDVAAAFVFVHVELFLL